MENEELDLVYARVGLFSLSWILPRMIVNGL